jgi:hypothetical protein
VVGDLEPLRTLFEVEGCTVTVAHVDDAGRLRLALRQVTLYRDPATREVVDRWRNPYTGRELAVVHQHLPAVRATRDGQDLRAPWLGTGVRASVFLEDYGVSHFPLVPAAAPAGAARRATGSAQLVAAQRCHRSPGRRRQGPATSTLRGARIISLRGSRSMATSRATSRSSAGSAARSLR